MSNAVTDVVIVGGGISGTATAYELARAGARVILLERGGLAGMASGRTLAGVRQSGRHPAELPLAKAAVQRWQQLGAELGADLEYRQEGNLRLARTPEEVSIIADIVREQRDLALDLEYLDGNRAVREIAPAIAKSVLAASFCPTDGHANPEATVEAYAAAARRYGASIATDATVIAIDVAAGRVAGVTTSAGKIAADVVIATAGVHSGHLCAPLGIELPISVRRVGVVQTSPMPPLLAQVLGVASADFAGRQEASGRFRFTGGGEPWPHDLDGFDAADEPMQPRVADIASSLAKAATVVPALAQARISRVWGGLLDMTPDALPVIERVGAIEGLIVAAGFSGHGFCLGPVTGEIVSQLALHGDTSYPIEPFRMHRFREGDALAPAAAPTLHG